LSWFFFFLSVDRYGRIRTHDGTVGTTYAFFWFGKDGIVEAEAVGVGCVKSQTVGWTVDNTQVAALANLDRYFYIAFLGHSSLRFDI
jgi:hypothetical protein